MAIFSGSLHNMAMTDQGELHSWGGEGNVLEAGQQSVIRDLFNEVDEAKGKIISQIVLSHNNTIILTGDPSRTVVDRKLAISNSDQVSNEGVVAEELV